MSLFVCLFGALLKHVHKAMSKHSITKHLTTTAENGGRWYAYVPLVHHVGLQRQHRTRTSVPMLKLETIYSKRGFLLKFNFRSRRRGGRGKHVEQVVIRQLKKLVALG